MEISEVFHGAAGVYAGPDEPYLFGRVRVSGPDRERSSYRSLASFGDPDGNGWLLQEVTHRAPGRVDTDAPTFTSSADLAAALRRAESAHGEHEKRTGGQRDVETSATAGAREPALFRRRELTMVCRVELLSTQGRSSRHALAVAADDHLIQTEDSLLVG
jgi:hypothetical protein